MIARNEKIVHLGLEIPENTPDILAEKLIEEINSPNICIEINKRPTLVYAAIEWVIPTAIVAYVLKPYFESFLQEVGKDHYIILKNWLKKTVDNGRAIKVTTITSDYSPDKIVNQDNQSKSVSLILQTKNDKSIKLLFDNDLEKEDWDNAIDQLLEYAIEHYEKYPNDKLTDTIKGFEEDIRFKIYVLIDKETKKLVFLDERQITRKRFEDKNKNANN
jgi:hypothetical protein